MRIHVGFSVDGLRWEIEESDFRLEGADSEIGQWVYGYDPRVAKIGDKYYVTWCNGYHGPTIGIAWTDDFETFHQLENAFLPYNRNGVLFPRKIGGRFAMLSRPSDTGHTPFGDIFYSESPDMEFWGRHRHVMSPSAFEVSAWQCMKIGAGPVPIETSEGWLLFYHGVLRSCNGYVYAFGSALLDLEEPWKVTARSGPYLISPRETYECMGDVPNVTFPCASLHDPETGRIAVYYGCADTVTGLAFGYIPEIIDFTKKTTSYEKPCAACGSDAVSGSTGTRACGVCGSVHRDYELRDREPRGRHAARDDVGGSVQRHGVGGERLRQGRPLVVHALRIP